MGILDEAIREHLELKRQHGAADSELQQLEDEAFGQAERPGGEGAGGSLAEARTQLMAQPDAEEEKPEGRREPSIADLQEPPPPPAVEDESAPEPEIEPPSHSTAEREAIAEQPTEMFDVEEELGSVSAPSDEEIVEEEIAEPRLSPTDPLAGLAETEEAEASVQGPAPADDEDFEDEDDAFWNEQRLSDELDQALEAPREEAPELETGLADVEPEPESHGEEEPEADDAYDEEDLEPESEELPAPSAEHESTRHEDDVLEETPDFLEETPEDDQLWFEQKPPKDFDFDD